MNPSLEHQLVIATSNKHKLNEINSVLADTSWQILSLQDFPEIKPIDETGSTFRENALLKARTVFQHTLLLTLADDSGLEVDALAGAPGVTSARYAGPEHDYAANNCKLLKSLEGIPAGPRKVSAQGHGRNRIVPDGGVRQLERGWIASVGDRRFRMDRDGLPGGNRYRPYTVSYSQRQGCICHDMALVQCLVRGYRPDREQKATDVLQGCDLGCEQTRNECVGLD